MRKPGTREMANVIRNMDQLPMYEFYYWQHGVSNKAVRIERMLPCCFHDERSASMHLHGANNNIFFKCFGCGKGGDIFKFVELSMKCDFKTAVDEIYQRFCSGMISLAGVPPRKIPSYHRTKEVTSIAYEEIPFSVRALQWWDKCGMTEADLRQSHYCQVSRVVITTAHKHYQIVSKRDDLTFVIYYDSGHVKVYRPLLDKEKKWRSNVEKETDLYGSWWLKPFEPAIIQCAGPRDAAITRKRTGIATIAPISENTPISPEWYQDIVKRLPSGTHPWLLYDNDSAGYKAISMNKELYLYNDATSLLRHHRFKDPAEAAEHMIKNICYDFFFSQLKSTIDASH